jgi:hypothetical protein
VTRAGAGIEVPCVSAIVDYAGTPVRADIVNVKAEPGYAKLRMTLRRQRFLLAPTRGRSRRIRLGAGDSSHSGRSESQLHVEGLPRLIRSLGDGASTTSCCMNLTRMSTYVSDARQQNLTRRPSRARRPFDPDLRPRQLWVRSVLSSNKGQ